MPQGEGSIINGTGSQTGSNRWGDYTSMNVDPVDDCTFWYVNQYIPTTSSIGWRLRIGSFRFAQCSLAPDFSLITVPESQEVCAPADAVYNIDVDSLQGFSDAITLSAVSNPGSAGFDPNPVTPPPDGTTSSILTISGAPAGMSHFEVAGTSGALSHSIDLGLIVRDAAPGAPTLTSPANGDKGVSNLPTFSWSEDLQATTYNLQVATDPGFSNVVASASGLMATSYTLSAPLDANTLYYWRVWAANTCGTGAYSAVSAFVTANRAIVTACSTPNLTIPDGSSTGAFNEQTLATLGAIIDLNVSVRATHSWVGDLDFTVQNTGTGVSAMIIDRPGVPASSFGCSQNHINALLDDQASLPVENQCATSNAANPPPYAINGTFIPNNPLSVFNGQALANTWRMTARDLASGDTGALNEWCLQATVEAASLPAAFADPADPTCAGNLPCFSGGSAIQQAFNAVASGGQVTVLGNHTVNTSLTCLGDMNVTGASGASITWNGGAGDMFTAWNCNLTLKGLSLDGGGVANIFNQVGAGGVTAYANNIGSYVSAYSGSGAPAIGHNFWGSKNAAAAAPSGMPAAEWLKRLGSTVVSWADSPTGSIALGGASLSGGAGTVAIVSFGRGAANAPFGNGISGHVDAMCSEFYDAFTVGGAGTWTLLLPVDAAPPECTSFTLNQDRLFTISDLSQCTPTDGECWDLAAGVTHTSSELVLAGLTDADLDGTHFVAGDTGGLDPTALKIQSFSSAASSWSLLTWILLALLALAMAGAWTARKAHQRA
jgi:subtilisin-like proprotein convertase family protein